eukprot:763690-Hanusia_phi.AAC.1
MRYGSSQRSSQQSTASTCLQTQRRYSLKSRWCSFRRPWQSTYPLRNPSRHWSLRSHTCPQSTVCMKYGLNQRSSLQSTGSTCSQTQRRCSLKSKWCSSRLPWQSTYRLHNQSRHLSPRPHNCPPSTPSRCLQTQRRCSQQSKRCTGQPRHSSTYQLHNPSRHSNLRSRTCPQSTVCLRYGLNRRSCRQSTGCTCLQTQQRYSLKSRWCSSQHPWRSMYPLHNQSRHSSLRLHTCPQSTVCTRYGSSQRSYQQSTGSTCLQTQQRYSLKSMWCSSRLPYRKHWEQVLADAAEIEPAEQEVHWPAPALEYVPAAQPEQTLDPALAYVPAEHCVHAVWLESEIVPAEHWVQVVQLPAPLAEYVPAAQPEQTLEPALAYVPAEHCVLAVWLESEIVPAEHCEHVLADAAEITTTRADTGARSRISARRALRAGACRRGRDVASRARGALASPGTRVITSCTTRADTGARACVRACRALRACGMARVRDRPSRALGARACGCSGDVTRRAGCAAPSASGRVRTRCTTRADTRACTGVRTSHTRRTHSVT